MNILSLSWAQWLTADLQIGGDLSSLNFVSDKDPYE